VADIEVSTRTEVKQAVFENSFNVLRQAISTGDKAAAVSQVDVLYSRHGAFSSWATMWWNAVHRALAAASTKSSELVDAVVGHIRLISKFADSPVQNILAAWLDTMTVAQKIECLGTKSMPGILLLLLSLVAERQLSPTIILDKLSYPIWQHASALCLSSRPKISGKLQSAIDSSIALAHQLLVVESSADLPPLNLQQAFVLQTARVEVFRIPSMQALIRHLPHLVVLDTSTHLTEGARAQISRLRRSLASAPEFKTAAFRHLDLLKDVFLSSDWSKKASAPALEAGMVDALKLIMSDGTSGRSVCGFCPDVR
jgi:mediator of RNA polymerase II transcription subunit 12